MQRHPIEKNSIQETLVIPLYGRALCTRKFPQLFADQTAAELLEQIDYDFSALEQRSGGLLQTFGALEVAMRQSDLAFEVREYLRAHPRAAVVNLGCGLDSTGRACDNGQCRIYNIDLPDVMAVREALLPAGERERNLAADLNDLSWFDAIDAPTEDGAVFFAAGVFYYFRTEQVRALCAAMAERFPGGRLVFDAAKRGDADCALLVENAAKYIGIALASAINMLDPDEIYLCGGLMKNGDEFFERIKYHTRKRQMQFAGRHVVICASIQDDWHVAKGATLMILDKGYKFQALSFLY